MWVSIWISIEKLFDFVSGTLCCHHGWTSHKGQWIIDLYFKGLWVFLSESSLCLFGLLYTLENNSTSSSNIHVPASALELLPSMSCPLWMRACVCQSVFTCWGAKEAVKRTSLSEAFKMFTTVGFGFQNFTVATCLDGHRNGN